ncbi:hypothetical protein ACIQ9J_01835 [Streptomyces sp. NPDC094153]|uniref:hypothetical protein n=1 Tax=Streptomyces sp. NPDC094153 TaxID=3366058 RepID=UPI003804F564
MKREELLAQARKHLWAAWTLSSEEIGSQAAATLHGLGMLVPEGGAQELEKLRARVAELEAQRAALAERLRAGQKWQRGRNPELVSENFVSQSELRSIFGIPLTAPWDEDPCHPCGCPKRFDRHAWGCPTLPAEADGITRRIAPTQALREDEPAEAPTLTVYRASHDSIVMGLYTTAAEARKHCETGMRREYDESTKVSLWWREDEDTVDQPEDGEQELFVHATPRGMDRGRTWRTGYVVTPLEVAAEYDPDGDE